ncbi:MAG: protease complex subunit PrcB family protein [candidate division WOR-3 bacterium]|jgi:hypothetical protein
MIFFLTLGSNPKEIQFEHIKNFGIVYPEKGIKIFKSYSEFENFFKSNTNIITDSIPKIDVNFNKEILIGVFLGQRPTSGYSISVEKVLLENKKIVVYANEICPKKDQMVLMVITYPSVFIKIPKYEYPVELKLSPCK